MNPVSLDAKSTSWNLESKTVTDYSTWGDHMSLTIHLLSLRSTPLELMDSDYESCDDSNEGFLPNKDGLAVLRLH